MSMMFRLLFTGRRLLMTLVVAVGVVVLCGLGLWQFDRFSQRVAQSERVKAQLGEPPVPVEGAPVDPAALEYRRVQVRGTFDPSQEILLRNRSLDGVTGYHLITPLKLSQSDVAVLVDRGWIPLTEASPEQRRAFAPPSGEVTIDGVARRSQEGTTGPVDPPLGPDRPRLDAWFRVNIPRIEQQTGYSLLPIFVEQQPQPGASNFPVPSATEPPGPGSHLSYAIQWFSFALTLAAGYVVLMYQQAGKAAPSGRE